MASTPRSSDAQPIADRLERVLPPEAVLRAGSKQYEDATSPDNSSFEQRPDAVVRATTAADVAATVRLARAAGTRVVVQSTGHGSAGPLGNGVVLLDTSAMTEVSVNPGSCTARVAAGATWDRVQEEAEQHGFLGLSGTSPTVGVAGYTFAGGVGWLARPHGLCSATLRAVEYVDGTGQVRRTDRPDSDPDVLWAFRGGAPVGIATELEIDLVAVPELWAGYLLWPVHGHEALIERLITEWLTQCAAAPAALTSAIALMQLPPQGPFPDGLLGQTVVHLSYASVDGPGGLSAMRQGMSAVAQPAVDTTGSSDATTLAQIHLDPPTAVPARGLGLWMNRPDSTTLLTILTAARIGTPDGLNMIELRHVDPAVDGVTAGDGAHVHASGPYLLHAVGSAQDETSRLRADQILAEVERRAAASAVGRSAPSFREGQPDAGDALTPTVRARLRAITDRTDPDRVFSFQRVPTAQVLDDGRDDALPR